jgi:nicotinamide-nucleotide amidase
MKHIMELRVLPWLPGRFKLPAIVHKTLLTVGIPESILSEKLNTVETQLPANMKLAYLPAFNAIRLRLTAKDANKTELEIALNAELEKIKTICAENLLTEGDVTPVQYMAAHLIKNKISISLAESCTGGFITNQFIQVPGISAVLNCGIVSYANAIKTQELGVPETIFTTVGAVSEECAKAMAEGCLKKFNTDVAISTTGIAGPGGATEEKPVGLVYIGVANKNKTIVKKMFFPGTRELFMQRVCNAAVDLLREVV